MFLHEYTKSITEFEVNFDPLFRRAPEINIGQYYFCSDINVITDLYGEGHCAKQPSCSMLYFCYVKLPFGCKIITKPDLFIKRDGYCEVYYFYYAGIKSDKMKIVDRDGILIIDPFPEFENANLVIPNNNQKSNDIHDLICAHTIYWMKFYDYCSDNNNIEKRLFEKFEERKKQINMNSSESHNGDKSLLFSDEFRIYLSMLNEHIYVDSNFSKKSLDIVLGIMIRTGQYNVKDYERFIRKHSELPIDELYSIWA